MRQYSKRTSVLHWLIFLLIIVAFFLGHELEESKDAAQKLSLYPVHFIIGNLVLLLTLLRIYFRKIDGEPAPANENPLLNKLASLTHVVLNLTLIALAVSGVVTVASSGLLAALQGNNPALIPDFGQVAAMGFHKLFIGVLVLLAVFHAAAAMYHQFIVKDNLMQRIMIKRF